MAAAVIFTHVAMVICTSAEAQMGSGQELSFRPFLMFSCSEDINELLCFFFFLLFGRDLDLQNTVVEGSLDVCVLDGVADIEASCACTAVALLSEDSALGILFLICLVVFSVDCQSAVEQADLDIFLFVSRDFNIQDILAVLLMDICLHDSVV